AAARATPTPKVTLALPTSGAAPAAGASGVIAKAIDGAAAVMVVGTDGAGLWIRDEPGGVPVKVWPEGAPLAVVGEERPADGRRWTPVRTLEGVTGWAASEFLGPASPDGLSELAGLP